MRPHACGLLCNLCHCCASSGNMDALAFYEDLEEKLRIEIEQEQVNLQDKTIGKLPSLLFWVMAWTLCTLYNAQLFCFLFHFIMSHKCYFFIVVILLGFISNQKVEEKRTCAKQYGRFF
jgi:hypothetical protein